MLQKQLLVYEFEDERLCSYHRDQNMIEFTGTAQK